MTDSKLSTLPHVLKEYKPDYDPDLPKSRSSHKCSTAPGNAKHQCHDNGQNKDSSKPPKSGRKSGRKTRKTDAQRYEELSTKWDQAKHEVRVEDREVLQEKIILQQELIRKQDEYAEQRRAQLAEADTQKRESEKARKVAQETEFKEICKQSLEEDKKAVKEGAKKSRQLRLKKDGSGTMPPSPTKSPLTPGTPGSRRSNPFKMTLPAMSATPDLGSDDEDDQPSPLTIPKDAPWHEQQLYKLYGKSADYFLHPKIETKTVVKKTNPKLRRQGVDELFANYWLEYEAGRAGAEVLWQTLRHDSHTRLLKEDASIPSELKDVYRSFARQSLQKTEIPVRRMYCIHEDLPEMPKLMDNRQLQKVRKMRYKSDLMYRASVSNEERTNVITFNNPLPEFHMGTDSVDQYLPSWQYDQLSESSIAEYKRWTRGRVAQENTLQELDEDNVALQKQPTIAQSMDDDLMYIISRRRPHQPKQKYHFLSEKDATVKGEFSEKYKDDRDYKDLPRPYKGDLPKSYSAMGGMLSASPDKTNNSTLRYSAPLPSRDALMRSYTTGWEPLSMHALVEYKRQVNTIGDGDFNLGRTKMWSHIPVI